MCGLRLVPDKQGILEDALLAPCSGAARRWACASQALGSWLYPGIVTNPGGRSSIAQRRPWGSEGGAGCRQWLGRVLGVRTKS